MNITLFPAMRKGIPQSVTRTSVSHGVVVADHFPNPPAYALLLADKGTPVLWYGRLAACEALVKKAQEDHEELTTVELKVYLRPPLQPLSAALAYTVRTALILAPKEKLRAALPNYVTLDGGTCMGEGGLPLPLLDYFIHHVCRGIQPTTIAMFTGNVKLAVHWALTSTQPVDMVVGVAEETPDRDRWTHTMVQASGDPIPPSLEEPFRARVQSLLTQGMPGWAGFEDEVLRESWNRREKEKQERDQRTAERKAKRTKKDDQKPKKPKAAKQEVEEEEEAAEVNPRPVVDLSLLIDEENPADPPPGPFPFGRQLSSRSLGEEGSGCHPAGGAGATGGAPEGDPPAVLADAPGARSEQRVPKGPPAANAPGDDDSWHGLPTAERLRRANAAMQHRTKKDKDAKKDKDKEGKHKRKDRQE